MITLKALVPNKMQKHYYLLDTNMLGYLVEVKAGSHSPEGKALQNRLAEIKSENVFICCITVGENRVWAQYSS